MSQPMMLLSPDMTDAERRMVVAAVRGELADLDGEAVRGSVLRDLILEARPGWLLPRAGLSLCRLVVLGGLDLDGAVVDKPLTLSEARIETIAPHRSQTATTSSPALVLASARVRRLTLHASVIDGSLLADRLEVDSSLLIGGGEINGMVHLRGAVVRGGLAVEGVALGDGNSALLAAGVRVGGQLVLRRSSFRGVTALSRSRIGGGLQGEGAAFNGYAGADIDLEGARVGGDVVLDGVSTRHGIVLAGLRGEGRVSLAQACIGELGVLAGGLSVDGALTLPGARLSGPLRLDGATVGGDLASAGLEVRGGDLAIALGGASIAGSIDLEAAKLVGALGISSARIRGGVVLANARLFGTALAVEGNGCSTGAGVSLARAVVFGKVALVNAEIGGSLSLAGASLKVESGEALDASGTSVRGDVDLGGGLSSLGGLRLERARIEHGRLKIAGSRIVALARANPVPPHCAADDLALGLSGARVATLEMPAEPGERPRGIVDFSHAEVGDFIDFAAAWPLPAHGRTDHLVLNGFVCERLVNPAGRPVGHDVGRSSLREPQGAARIGWLEAQSESDLDVAFKRQPWSEVARHLSAAGLHDQARSVMLAGLRRQRRAMRRRGPRWASHLDDLLTGYGHRPWRPVVALAVVMLAFAGLYAAGMRCPEESCGGPAFVARAAPAQAGGITVRADRFEPVLYSLDVLVPLLDSGQAEQWRENPAWLPELVPGTVGGGGVSGGDLLGLARFVERGLGILLAALAFAGLVRAPRRLE
ncbi:MAG: hypothetical protein JNM89_07030 [Hyphomicrobiaceae bacterium]|nr:hypothetical protein [Hyphomicrobiaceae bacterium]